MNKSILLIAPVLAAFAVSPALADRGGKGKGKSGKGHDKHVVVRDADHRRPVVVVDRDDRRPTVIVRDRDDRFDGRHDNGLHLGWYKQQWKRGDRIEWKYVQPNYYVYDYDRYDLRPAPVGYRWVRPMDDRYLLVEIATGLIVDALGY
jgi:Ni/Co efflux regulator RcnB